MSVVHVVTVEPRPIATVRRRTTFDAVPHVLLAGLDIVWPVVRSKLLQKHGHNVAVYRLLGGGAVKLLCGVQVAAHFDDVGEIVCSETPGGEAATATHVGPYERLGETYDAISVWVQRAGRRLAGVNWEIYGDWNDDPVRLETEIYMLVEPEAAGA